MPFSEDDLYSTPEEAVVELHRRRSNAHFMSDADAIFGSETPEGLGSFPRAILSRSIATPNFEMELFKNEADAIGLPSVVLEFGQGKFVAKNPEKYYLCKLFFARTLDDNRRIVTGSANVIDFNSNEGKSFLDIQTLQGDTLIDFHHNFLRGKYGSQTPEVFDFSDWFLRSRGQDNWTYYVRFLSLFFYKGVLFENFLMEGEERTFTETVVIPAFKTLTDLMGVKPLIVRITPKESENDSSWCYYHDELRKLIA